MRLEVPVSVDLARELIRLWADIFKGYPLDVTPEMLLGDEQEHNSHTLYIENRGDRLAGTCHLTVSKRVPILAGFGEVATVPEFRRSGIATRLCAESVEDLRAGGVEAVFLGTNQSDAARVYHRLGWRRMAGTNVMANITSGDTPEAFLVDYFRDQGPASVGPATPDVRIAMIPLIVAPHDWQVLDANVGLFSTRYRLQPSCMGLFTKYQAALEGDRGGWFAARTGQGRVVGLATARLDGAGGCQVDGFAHKYFLESWDGPIKAAMDWGASQGTDQCWAAVSVEDEDKRALFQALGFRQVGPADDFDLDGRAVGSIRMAIASHATGLATTSS